MSGPGRPTLRVVRPARPQVVGSCAAGTPRSRDASRPFTTYARPRSLPETRDSGGLRHAVGQAAGQAVGVVVQRGCLPDEDVRAIEEALSRWGTGIFQR